MLAKIPFYYSKFIDQVEVLTNPRDLDARALVWKGASVIPRLDLAQVSCRLSVLVERRTSLCVAGPRPGLVSSLSVGWKANLVVCVG